jgi:S-adenosylmethionine decarboxylase
MSESYMGHHLLIDLKSDRDLDDVDNITTVFKGIINNHNMTILNTFSHKFTPQGVTILFTLSESHVSYHSYPECKSCAIDFYFCGKNAKEKLEIIVMELSTWFNSIKLSYRIIERYI